MRQFFNILHFEFSSYLKNKLFVGTTIILVVAVAAVLSFPRITGLFASDEKVDTTEKSLLLVSSTAENDSTALLANFAKAMPQNEFSLTEKTQEELTLLVESGECNGAIILHSPIKYTYIVKDITMYDQTPHAVEEVLTANYKSYSLEKLGVSATDADRILNSVVEGETLKTGKDQMQNFFYTYILIFALYMAILLYGQFVATSIATEKSSRAMELLITSANPNALMFGKVLGSGLAGLLQLSAALCSSFVFFNLNRVYWEDNGIINSVFNMPLSILLYTILFFILGYFIYAFLYGAVGSLASKVEDINTSSMPLTLLFIVAFFISMFSMASGKVDSPLMIVASYVPFSSPMAMFVRISMGNVTPVEIAISVLILIVSTVGIGLLSAKIYKMGVLMYGTPPKLSNILKNLNK